MRRLDFETVDTLVQAGTVTFDVLNYLTRFDRSTIMLESAEVPARSKARKRPQRPPAFSLNTTLNVLYESSLSEVKNHDA
jgi:hypothetical protein